MLNYEREIGKLITEWHTSMNREPNEGKKAVLFVMLMNDIKWSLETNFPEIKNKNEKSNQTII